ncbi:MAG TPA: vitamin K epoxide reductase family protein [Solirubrobacterales bacterium]|nr:vitamin K epoxide reductase family protein [Solirubrobacterales bacterium]
MAPEPAPTEPGEFLERIIGWLIAIASLIAFLAAVILMIEKLKLIGDPEYVPTCSINPVLSCGSIMESEQAEAFGFPNPLLGIVGFGGLAMIGASIVAGARIPRWMWLTIQAGVTFAFGFVCWLIFQSLYRIEALCPYCMVVWVAVFALFLYTTLFNFTSGNIPAPNRLRSAMKSAAGYHGVILTASLLTVALLIAEAFWSYWRTLF